MREDDVIRCIAFIRIKNIEFQDDALEQFTTLQHMASCCLAVAHYATQEHRDW